MKWVVWIVVLGWLVAVVTLYGRVWRSEGRRVLAGLSDFRCFYMGGKMWNFGVREDFYTFETQDRWQKKVFPEIMQGGRQTLYFFYPIMGAWWWGVLAKMSIEWAHVVVIVVYGTIMVGLGIDWTRECRKWMSGEWGWGVVSMVTFYPAWATLVSGQWSILLAGVVWWVKKLLDKQQDVLGGTMATLLLIKPQFWIWMYVFGILQKKWRMVWGMSLGLGVVGGMMWGWLGTVGVINYVSMIRTTGEWVNRNGINVFTMTGLWGLVQTFGWVGGFLMMVVAGWGGWSLIKNYKTEIEKDLQWLMLGLLMLVINVHANFIDLTMMIAFGVGLIKHWENKWVRNLFWVGVLAFSVINQAWMVTYKINLAALYLVVLIVVVGWRLNKVRRVI